MNRHDLPPTVSPGELPPDHPRGLMARFRNYFLTGLVVAGPIAITFYLTWWFVTWVDGLVRPFVPAAYRPETYLPFGLPGSGLIVAEKCGITPCGGGVDRDDAFLGKTKQRDRTAGFRTRARKTAAAEWLHTDHGADLVAVHIGVAYA